MYVLHVLLRAPLRTSCLQVAHRPPTLNSGHTMRFCVYKTFHPLKFNAVHNKLPGRTHQSPLFNWANTCQYMACHHGHEKYNGFTGMWFKDAGQPPDLFQACSPDMLARLQTCTLGTSICSSNTLATSPTYSIYFSDANSNHMYAKCDKFVMPSNGITTLRTSCIRERGSYTCTPHRVDDRREKAMIHD